MPLIPSSSPDSEDFLSSMVRAKGGDPEKMFAASEAEENIVSRPEAPPAAPPPPMAPSGQVNVVSMPDYSGVRPSTEPVDVPTMSPYQSFKDATNDAFRLSYMGSLVDDAADRMTGETPAPGLLDRTFGRTDPGFNPFDHIAGYEQYPGSFVGLNSLADIDAMKKKIDREKEAGQRLSEGGIEGLGAELLVGAADPIMLLPIGGAERAYQVGGSILARTARVGAVTAVAGGVAAAASNAITQATVETQTTEQSAMNIGASVLLSGILGAGGAAIGSHIELNRMVKMLDDDMTVPAPNKADLNEPGSIDINGDDLLKDTEASVGARAVDQTTMAEETLKNAFGVERVTSGLNPLLRMSTSRSIESRRAIQQLADTPFYYEKNALGIATPQSVETRVNVWDGNKARTLIAIDDNLVAYTKRMKQEGKPPLTPKAFREEIGRAMRRNDEHPIPEVANAAKSARRELFDPLKKEAIEAGLLPEGVKVETADSYLTRVWDKRKIVGNQPRLQQILDDWLRDAAPELSKVDRSNAAGEIIDKLKATPEGRIPYDLTTGPRGPLKERTLSIPDHMVEDFLESDVELVANFYKRSMAPDVELTKTFGDVTGKDMVAKIADDYNAKILKAESPDVRLKLQKKMRDDIRDFEAVRDIIRGTYGAPKDPDSVFVRAGRVARTLQYMSKMGQVTLSSVSDVARPVMVHGFQRVMRDGLVPLISDIKSFKLGVKDVQEAGSALDMVLDTRSFEWAEISDLYARGTKLEKGLHGLSKNFSKLTLMTQWNTAMKSMSGVVTQSRILRAADKMQRGAAVSAKESEYLALLGIDSTGLARIGKEFATHGAKERGLYRANLADWGDKYAAGFLKNAINKEVKRIILEPGAADRPLWMSSELGKTIGQFRSFTVAANQRMLIAGLQQRDAAFLGGLVTSVSLGMLSYAMTAEVAGRELPDDPRQWIVEGIDRSGILAVFSEANNISEKFTGYGLNTLAGASPMSRFASRNRSGALFGPTLGTVEDVGNITYGATNEWTKQDSRALRRLLPYQNLFYTRWLFDQVEQGANDALGVKDKKK